MSHARGFPLDAARAEPVVDAALARDFGPDARVAKDLAREGGPESEEKLLALAKEQLRRERGEPPADADTYEESLLKAIDLSAKGPAPHRTRFRAASDVMKDAPPEAVIEGLLYRRQATVIVAESGAGKSFVLASMAGALADPGVSEWAGRELVTGTVALVLFERDAVSLRLRALEEQGHDLRDVHLLFASESLSPVGREGPEIPSGGELGVIQDLVALRAQLEAKGRPPIVLLAIDTIRASMAGTEESSRDVAAYLRAVDRIARSGAPGAAVALAHHVGWQDGEQARKRERGSSALRGNVDVTLLLEHDGEPSDPHEVRLILRTLKNRDEERGAPIRLVRRRVVLTGFGPKGRLLTSCVIEPDRRTAGDVQAEERAAQEAQEREDDLRVLRLMVSCPDATSIERLRARAGIARPRALAAVGRLLAAGWAREGPRGCPYEVLQAGRAALETHGDRRGPNGTGDPIGPAGPRRGPGTPPEGGSRSSDLFGAGPGTAGRYGGDRT